MVHWGFCFSRLVLADGEVLRERGVFRRVSGGDNELARIYFPTVGVYVPIGQGATVERDGDVFLFSRLQANLLVSLELIYWTLDIGRGISNIDLRDSSACPLPSIFHVKEDRNRGIGRSGFRRAVSEEDFRHGGSAFLSGIPVLKQRRNPIERLVEMSPPAVTVTMVFLFAAATA
jgi:hypothetical protein